MRKLLGACFALSLIGAAACGGSKKAPANPDNTMNNAGGSEMGSGSGSASGSGSGMNPCNGAAGGGSSMAPDPCSGAE